MILLKATILYSLLLTGILTGCTASQPGETPEVDTDNQLLNSGLLGQILSASDVNGIPDTPLPDQVVLAFPESTAPRILGTNSSLTDTDLRFLKADIPAQDPKLTIAISGPDGQYQMNLPPGKYIVCLAESQDAAGAFPVSIRGCGRVNIHDDEQVGLDISSGFGEILLISDP